MSEEVHDGTMRKVCPTCGQLIPLEEESARKKTRKRRSKAMLLLILLTLIASAVAYHEIYSHELFCYVMVSHNGGEFIPNRQIIPTIQINKWMIGMYVASACATALLIGWLCNKTRIISIITVVFAIIGAAGLIYGYSIWDNKELLPALAFALIPSFIVFIASIVGMTRKG